MIRITVKNLDDFYLAEAYEGSFCAEETGNTPDEALGALVRNLDLSGTFARTVKLRITYLHDKPKMVKERWVFTQEELLVPATCKRDDEFIVLMSDILPEDGVLMRRDGLATNRYGDGTAGVTEDHAELAEGVETYATTGDNPQLADIWRDVFVDPDSGEFIGFLPGTDVLKA